MQNMQQHHSGKLEIAIRSLEDALKYARSGEFQELGIEFKSVLVSAVIQNFKLTLDVCRRLITHLLRDDFGDNAVEGKSFEEILRMAEKEGIVSSLDRWLGYAENDAEPSSNISGHVFDTATAFMADVALLFQMSERRSATTRQKAA